MQGMQNTNKNIGRMNSPPNNFTNPYIRPNTIGLGTPRPPYIPDFGPGANIIGQGGLVGGLIDNEMINPWQPIHDPDVPSGPTQGPIYQDIGVTPGFGDSELGIIDPVGPDYDPGNIVDTNFLQENPDVDYGPGGGVTTPDINESPLFTQGSMEAGFDVNNDGVIDILDYTYAQSHSQGTTSEGIGDFQEYLQSLAQGGGWTGTIDNPSHTSLNEFIQDYVENYNWDSGWGQQGPTPPSANMTPEETQQWIDTMSSEEMSQFQGVWGAQYGQQEGTSTLDQSYQDWLTTEWGSDYEEQFETEFQQQIGGENIPYEQGFLENLSSYINPQELTSQQFRGGGGQAGTAAKRLHYPGTQGGFASTGSGIGGGNTLEELLKQMQG